MYARKKEATSPLDQGDYSNLDILRNRDKNGDKCCASQNLFWWHR